jgi:hypothetical protein
LPSYAEYRGAGVGLSSPTRARCAIHHVGEMGPEDAIEREAARCLAEAIALVAAGLEPDRRERHRRLLEQAVEHAERARALAEGDLRCGALSVLARAHAAQAQDALHGAGQLSLSAQRAPTPAACDEGWLRVGAIVAAAEESARAAGKAVRAMEEDCPGLAQAGRAAAGVADAAARAARRLVDERNHAYTFHTDHGFSFGEGWYLAAASVLGGVAIQIEPGGPAAAQADRFLRDAGLGDRLLPYRPRPRANKQTTDVVARAFRAGPLDAQRRLRTAFLGDAPIVSAVSDWIDPRLASCRDRPKVLLWIRDGAHHPGRNTVVSEVLELSRSLHRAGVVPVLVGDALRGGAVPADAVDMILFWKDAIFRGSDARRVQLQFFEHLRRSHGVVGQLGVTTAGMDGPALMGMPTMYLTDASNVRMREWVGAVPGYREIVRERGYLERVIGGVSEWARSG